MNDDKDKEYGGPRDILSPMALMPIALIGISGLFSILVPMSFRTWAKDV